MHDPARLTAALGQSPQTAFVGLTYRAIDLKHFPTLIAARPLFTPSGGQLGSRYVAPGGPESLYVAPLSQTAFRELNGLFFEQAATPVGTQLVRVGSLRPAAAVLIGVHVNVAHVLDLTNRTVRTGLGIKSAAELLGRWRNVPNAPTQVLGAAVFASQRFHGILYPSARHLGRDCLVLFRPRLLAPSQVEFRDAGTNLSARLP